MDRAGEGLLTLQRAFQMAGAKTVIASLWNVDDECTVELMRSLYRRLWCEGASRIDALRSAQLEVLSRNRAGHQGRGLPWTWGAFVLYGDWR
jgi:CHAT domain-containing protein